MYTDFYIYEHWRPDTSKCFYVGKGRGRRAYRMNNRNEWHTRIVNKLKESNFFVEVRLVVTGLTEEQALEQEKVRVKFWRDLGYQLVNLTGGGDGVRCPSEETREKMRLAHKRRQTPEAIEKCREKTNALWANAEWRKNTIEKTKEAKSKIEYTWGYKISNALKGKKKSESHIANLSGDKNHFLGKVHSEEAKAKISAKKTGTKLSEQTKANMKIAQAIRRKREVESV